MRFATFGLIFLFFSDLGLFSEFFEYLLIFSVFVESLIDMMDQLLSLSSELMCLSLLSGMRNAENFSFDETWAINIHY